MVNLTRISQNFFLAFHLIFIPLWNVILWCFLPKKLWEGDHSLFLVYFYGTWIQNTFKWTLIWGEKKMDVGFLSLYVGSYPLSPVSKWSHMLVLFTPIKWELKVLSNVPMDKELTRIWFHIVGLILILSCLNPCGNLHLFCVPFLALVPFLLAAKICDGKNKWCHLDMLLWVNHSPRF